MKNECIGCTERHLYCHTDCQKYIEACKENEERKERIEAVRREYYRNKKSHYVSGNRKLFTWLL